MKKYKTCKVVMLPSSREAGLGSIYKQTALKLFGFDGNRGDLSINVNPNVIKTNESFEAQHLYILSDDEIKVGDYYYSWIPVHVGVCSEEHINTINQICEKVIASTDISLGIPAIPDFFIKKYVDKKGKIDEVEVVVDSDGLFEVTGEEMSIVIKESKNTWTKEEAIELCRKAWFDGVDYGQDYAPEYRNIDDWIEQNIK